MVACCFCKEELGLFHKLIDGEPVYDCSNRICSELSIATDHRPDSPMFNIWWGKYFIKLCKHKVRESGQDVTFTAKTIKATYELDEDLAICMMLRNTILDHCRILARIKRQNKEEA